MPLHKFGHTTSGLPSPCGVSSLTASVRLVLRRLILLTPLWPSQPWYTVVPGTLEDIPRLLPTREDLIFLHPGQEFQMPEGCPSLVAWPISGNPSHHEKFLQKLQNTKTSSKETLVAKELVLLILKL